MKDEADPFGDLAGCDVLIGDPADAHVAPVWGREPGDELENGRLARTGSPNQSNRFTRRDVQGEAVENLMIAVGERQVIDRQRQWS